MCLPHAAKDHQNDMLRYMGEVLLGHHFGTAVGWVFGLLLISAVNTALTGMVALLYVMAHDGEMPERIPAAQSIWRALGCAYHRDGFAGNRAEYR